VPIEESEGKATAEERSEEMPKILRARAAQDEKEE
jgi:hypothetical protein